jgi:hypothetical protein
MIYTASGKALKRALGFLNELVPAIEQIGSRKSVTAVATKSVSPIRRSYARKIPPAIAREGAK